MSNSSFVPRFCQVYSYQMYKVKALEPCTTQKRLTKRAPDGAIAPGFAARFAKFRAII